MEYSIVQGARDRQKQMLDAATEQRLEPFKLLQAASLDLQERPEVGFCLDSAKDESLLHLPRKCRFSDNRMHLFPGRCIESDT